MKTTLRHHAKPFEIALERENDHFHLDFFARALKGEILRWSPPDFTIGLDGEIWSGTFYRGQDFIDVHLPQGNFRLRYQATGREGRPAHAPGELTSPMPGKIIKVLVAAGDKVQPGETLMVLEAMKMEHKIQSPVAGTVQKVLYQEGERVGQDVELVRLNE